PVEPLRIDPLPDAEVAVALLLGAEAELGEILGLFLAAQEARQLLRRHRRQAVGPGGAVNAEEGKEVRRGGGHGMSVSGFGALRSAAHRLVWSLAPIRHEPIPLLGGQVSICDGAGSGLPGFRINVPAHKRSVAPYRKEVLTIRLEEKSGEPPVVPTQGAPDVEKRIRVPELD